MDLFMMVRAVLRRWPLILLILLITGALAYLVETRTAPEYEATGVLVLGAPNLDITNGGGTPLDPVQLSQGIQLGDVGDALDFTVSSLGGNNYAVTATASGSEQAESAVEALIEQLGQQVLAVQEQDGVLEPERVDLRLVSPQVTSEVLPDGTFLAGAQVFLYDPMTGSTNPYGPDASTGRLLQVEVSSDAAHDEFVRRAGDGVDFVVGQEARDAAPLLSVVTTGSNARQVIDAFDIVRDMLVEELREREDRAGVTPSQRLSLEVIDAPMGVVDTSPPVTRAAILVIGLGVMLALGLTIGAESIRRHRDRRVATPTTPATRPTSSPGAEGGNSGPAVDAHGPVTPGDEPAHSEAVASRPVQEAIRPS